jgi:arylsulfatase A-like enzyme
MAGGRLYLLTLAMLALGCRAERPPNVCIVVIDTLRTDRVGWLSGDRGVTPFLDTLADRAFVFPHAYAASSWTSPSIASLWTSRYPSQHHVTSAFSVLADSERTLAEMLAKRGYVTGGFSANPLVSTQLGYQQGFDRYEATAPGAQAGLWAVKERADKLNAKALAWLDEVRGGPRAGAPVFLYLQYMEPHFPYIPPRPFVAKSFARHDDGDRLHRTFADMLREKSRWAKPDPEALAVMEALYDGEVMSVDEGVRDLFAELTKRGILDDAIVVVTSDHGEEFLDHGGMGHGLTLYEEVARVPLFLRLPGQAARQDVDEEVSLLDVTPTLLDLLGILRPATVEGRSLASRLRSPSLRRYVGVLVEWLYGHRGPRHGGTYSELDTGAAGETVRHHRATVLDARKVIVTADGTLETYDLRHDPREQETGRLTPAEVTAVQDVARQFARRAMRAPAPSYVMAPDADTTARLRALGYLP